MFCTICQRVLDIVSDVLQPIDSALEISCDSIPSCSDARPVGPEVGVKASGGVRTIEAMRAMVAAGATRIRTSDGVALVTQSGMFRTATDKGRQSG